MRFERAPLCHNQAQVSEHYIFLCQLTMLCIHYAAVQFTHTIHYKEQTYCSDQMSERIRNM